MNSTTEPPAKGPSLWRRILLPGGGWLYWLAMLLALAIAGLPLFTEPLLRPLADQALAQASARLADRLGMPVAIGFADLYLSVGIDNVYLQVERPYIELDGRRIAAGGAAISITETEIPELVLHDVELELARDADGALLLAGIPLAGGGQAGATLPALPADLVVHGLNLAYTGADGRRLALRDLQLSVRHRRDHDAVDISVRSAFEQTPKFAGKASLTLGENPAAVFYLEAEDFSELLQTAGARLDMQAETEAVQVWGSLDGDSLNMVTQASVEQLAGRLPAPPASGAAAADVADVADQVVVATPASAASLTLASASARARISLQEVFGPYRSAQIAWHLAAGDALLSLPPGFTDAPVALATLEGSGFVSLSPERWSARVSDLRLAGPAGLAAIDLRLRSAPAGLSLSFNLAAPRVDAAVALGILPASVGPKSINFLRDSVRAEHMQIATLAIDSDQLDRFPWPGDDGGRFRLDAAFAGTAMDYAAGYPPIAGASGAFGISGTAFAITIFEGAVGPVAVNIARAGIDDLDAAEVTLHVATDARLGDGQLLSLLEALPAARTAAERSRQIGVAGSQDMEIALTIPVDTDDPILVDGRLTPLAGSALVYKPMSVTIADLAGDFLFSAKRVDGVALGTMLDTGIRLSLGIDETDADFRIDGAFDMADALRRLDFDFELPISGESQVAATISDAGLQLRADLRNAAVELPAPLGKPAGVERILHASVADGRAEIAYGRDLARAIVADGRLALAVGSRATLALPAAPGSNIDVDFAGLDLDAIIAASDSAPGALPLPASARLRLGDSVLAGLTHPTLRIDATLATTLTVATIASEALSGEIRAAAASPLQLSLSHLYLPRDEDDDGPPAADATVYVEPGVTTPALPDLRAVIDDLHIGDTDYHNVVIAGAALDGAWRLDRFHAELDGGVIEGQGTTNTAGKPYTAVSISVAAEHLDRLVGNFVDGESVIGEGSGALTGALTWAGAIHDPHFLSMTGELDVSTSEFVLYEGSSGVALLNLLSPFTLLQTLPETSVGETLFERAGGRLSFANGDMTLHDFNMISNSMDINIGGSTNLITERNDLDSRIKLNTTDDIATSAIAVVNPLAGALLLVFDKVFNIDFIDPLGINYHVTGTWDEPVYTPISSVQLDNDN